MLRDDRKSGEYDDKGVALLWHRRKQRHTLSISYTFQVNQIWLLTLEPNNADKILLVGFKLFSDLIKHLPDKEFDFTLFNSLMTYLGRGSFMFTPPPKDGVCLSSGNIVVMNDKASKLWIKYFLYY